MHIMDLSIFQNNATIHTSAHHFDYSRVFANFPHFKSFASSVRIVYQPRAHIGASGFLRPAATAMSVDVANNNISGHFTYLRMGKCSFQCLQAALIMNQHLPSDVRSYLQSTSTANMDAHVTFEL